MLNIKFCRFVKDTNNKYQHTPADSPISGETVEMLELCGDISRILPVEIVHKLCDCYVDMINEVSERLQNLYGDILFELHGIQYSSHEKPGNYKDCLKNYAESDIYLAFN
jgi:hypothetical protein